VNNKRIDELQIQLQEINLEATRKVIEINLEKAAYERDKAKSEAATAASALRVQELTEAEIRKAIAANDLPKIKSFSS
jgi:hypothetical protein